MREEEKERGELDETDEYEVVCRDRGKRTRNDERWIPRWIDGYPFL